MTEEENRKLCEEYPFLKFYGEPLFSGYTEDEATYKYTWADELPSGWRKAFGNKIWDELKDILIKGNYLDKFRFVEIKEKYGTLRLYNNGYPVSISEELQAWENKYEDLSMLYCIDCGKPTKYITQGYITYVCENCADEINDKKELLTLDDVPIRRLFDGNSSKYIEIESPCKQLFIDFWGGNKNENSEKTE